MYKACRFTLKTLNNKNLDCILKTFNLKKNETKFFAFEYCNETTNIINNNEESLYPIGLFQRCETNKRSGIYSKKYNSILIDNSKETLNKIVSTSDNIKELSYYNIKNYSDIYNSFYKKIINSEYNFNINKKTYNIKVNDFLTTKKTHEIKSKQILHFLKDNNILNEIQFNKFKINIIIYLIYFDYFKFIKDILILDESIVEGFVVVDKINNIYYKITGDFMMKVFEKNQVVKKKELLSPILPGVF